MHKTYTFENGFKIIFIPRKNSKICRINTHVDAGSVYDSDAFPLGTSHFVEHMLFNGSTKYPVRENLLNLIHDNGGMRSAYTSHFEQQHSLTILIQYIESAFEYLSQTLLHPKLTKESFSKEKDIILTELMKNESTQERIFYTKGVGKAIFKAESLYNYPLGNYRSIQLITLEDIRLFHSSFFNISRITLFISGDLNEEKILELGRKYFTGNEIKAASKKTTPFSIKTHPPKDIKIYHEGMKNVKISCAKFIPNIDTSEYLSLLFLIQILCVGVQSRLFKELREKRKLIYDIHPNNMCSPQGLLIGIVTQCSKENISEIKKVILLEIKKISIYSVSEKELLKIKKRYWLLTLKDNDSTVGVCNAYFKYFRKFRSFYDWKDEKKQVNLITIENIKKSAQNLLENEMSWITMASKE